MNFRIEIEMLKFRPFQDVIFFSIFLIAARLCNTKSDKTPVLPLAECWSCDTTWEKRNGGH